MNKTPGLNPTRRLPPRHHGYSFWFGYVVVALLLGIGAWFAFVPFNVQVLGTTVACGSALSGSYISGTVPSTLSPCVSEANQRLGIAGVLTVMAVFALLTTVALTVWHGLWAALSNWRDRHR